MSRTRRATGVLQLPLGIKLPDSPIFTPHGRALLDSLGVLDHDAEPIAAEDWPQEWLDDRDRFINTPWKKK